MKSLVIGFGSMGSRHARILKSMGCDVAVVCRRDMKSETAPLYKNVFEAVRVEAPDYAVIANETARHYKTLDELAQTHFKGLVLVEKPLFSSFCKTDINGFKNIFIGYNLRFHPLIQRLRALLEDEKTISAQVYVGRYLPKWRPQKDYRHSYSASHASGGGVLRDLSHEIDYLLWLFGPCLRVAAIGGHFSRLEIKTDDVFGVMMEAKKCPLITLQMNYLDRFGRREILVNTDEHTFKADLISGKLWVNENEEDHKVDADFTYRAEHEAVLSGHYHNLCTLGEGAQVMRLIEAVEKSAIKKQWVAL